MWIPSKLQGTTLGDVLGGLYRERASGALELVESEGLCAGQVHRIHLRNGLVTDIESRVRTRRLGEILQLEGLVDATAAPTLDKIPLFAGERRYGQVLLDAGIITPRALSQAVERQQRDRLDGLYRLPNAQLRFRVAQRRPSLVGALPLGPSDFLHGRPRARDVGASRPREQRRDSVRDRALRTLGLGEKASARDVQDAFRRLAVATHPDRFPSAPPGERAQLAQRFSMISSAYHALIA